MVEQWLTQPGSPLVLALLRIAVFGGLVYTGTMYDPWAYAALPRELVLEPDVGGWLLGQLPMSPALAIGVWVAMVLAAAAAMIGWRVRLTGTIAVVTAVYVLGISAMFGKVDHSHHLLWIGAVLAVSPCADRLAIGADRRARPSAVYGFPLRVTWLLIGVVYLGAAIPKIGSAGLEWAFSDNLRNHMWIHWDVLDVEPIARFDEWPWLYRTAALATLVFEVGFVFAVLWRRSRGFAATAGLAFHVATKVTVGIIFHTLMACYVAFLPSRSTDPADDRQPGRAAVGVGVAVLAAALSAALLTIPDGWPVASYPAFHATGPDRVSYTLTDGGEPVTADVAGLGEHGWRWLVQRVGREPELLPVLADHLDLENPLLIQETIYTDPDDRRVVDSRMISPG